MKFMKKGEEIKLADKVDKHYSSAGPHNTSFMCRHYYGAYFVCLFILGAAISLFTSDNTFAAASTISLNVSSDVISVDVASLTTTGTFAKSNNVTITASTNNATGYELKVAAANSSDPSHLINTSDSSAKLSSITSATTEAQFSALTGTAYNGKWGYLPSKYDSTANTDFLPAPDTTGDVINKTECANGTSPCPAQDTYTMAIGARVDSTTRIGAYENTYVILATANAIPYTIIYDDNVVGNMPVDVNSTSVSTSIPISSNTPTRDGGYTFLGWCTASTPVVTDPSSIMSTCASAGGIMYQPGSSWTISQTGTNNLHLYAMWGGNPLAMQTWSSEQCDSMQVDDVITLIDTRDNQRYRISKLADDNCWMLDNLRLDPTAVSLATLKGKTNASDTTLEYFKDGGGSSPYPATGVNATWDSSSDDKYNQPKVVTTYKDTTTTSYGAGSGKIGVYYNFCAASAGSYCYAQVTGTGNATEDLCPAGWRMPTGGDSGEYDILFEEYYEYVDAFLEALSTPLSGNFFGGSAFGQGTTGIFWSSTRNDVRSMYDLAVGSDVNPAGNRYRSYGLSMRCLLDS